MRLSSLSKATWAADLLAINVGHAWVQQPARQERRHATEVLLSWLRAPGARPCRPRGDAVLDGLNELADFSFDSRELAAGGSTVSRDAPSAVDSTRTRTPGRRPRRDPGASACREVRRGPVLPPPERLMVRRLVHVPRDLAPKRARRSRQYMNVPATALGALRETREQILRAPCLVEPLRIAIRCHARISACRAFTWFQSSSSTILSSGTAVVTHSDAGFGRETRLPVSGSLMSRRRFHTSRPT